MGFLLELQCFLVLGRQTTRMLQDHVGPLSDIAAPFSICRDLFKLRLNIVLAAVVRSLLAS